MAKKKYRKWAVRGFLGPQNVPFVDIFGVGSTGFVGTPVTIVSEGLRELQHLVGGFSIHGLLHGLRIRWLTFLMIHARTTTLMGRAFRKLKGMMRNCDSCILMLACQMAAHPKSFQTLVTEISEALPETVEIMSGLVIRTEEDANRGLHVSALHDVCALNTFRFVPPVRFYLEGGLGVSPRTFALASILGALTVHTFGRLALSNLRKLILGHYHSAAQAYASAAICAFGPTSDTARDLIAIVRERGNPFARHAVRLLGCIGSTECIDVLKKVACLTSNNEIASEAITILKAKGYL
jgi:hypothetical protein